MDRFQIDSMVVSPEPFQGHHEVRLAGEWQAAREPVTLAPGTYVIQCDQPLGVLAVYLLEPRSDDLLIWSIGAAPHRAGTGIGNRLLGSTRQQAHSRHCPHSLAA